MWHVQFTHPAMLYLAGGAAVPLIIHLLRRHRLRVVRFPAVRYLHATTRKRLLKIDLKRLLLLVLRMLMVALLALVLARPIVGRGASAAGAAATEGTELPSSLSAVIVLDDSLSMNYRRGDVSWFERAQNDALHILSRLPAGAEAAVTTTSRPALRFTREPADLRAQVTGLRPTLEGNSCPPALRRAAEALRERPAAAKALFVLTDMTRAAWSALPLPAEGEGAAAPLDAGEDVAVEIVLEGEANATNLAVTKVSHEGAPVFQGARLQVRAQLMAVGEGAEEMVEFEFDGRVVDRRRVSLAADGIETVWLSVPVPTPGHHWGRVGFLNPDGLPYDNSRGFTLEAPDAVSVLCVDDSVSPDGARLVRETMERSYFFRSALSPWEPGRQGIFRTWVARPEELSEQDLAEFDMVALIDAPAPGGAGAQRVADFVASGGALLASFGPGADPEGYRAGALARVLPALPGEVVGQPSPTEGPLRMRAVLIRHPLVEALAQAGADVGRARFYYCRRVEPTPASEEVFAFGPGLPALVLGRSGGRVAVFAGSLGPQWGDLPRQPEFVPFCQELVLYLTGMAGARLSDFEVGQQVPIRFRTSSWPTIVTVMPPGSEERIRVMPGATPGQCVFWQTDAPGYYRVEFSRKDAQWSGGFSVNTDPTESDLRRVDPDRVRRAIRGARVRVHEELSTLTLAGGGAEGGGWRSVELTPYLVFACLLAWAVEGFLANRVFRAAPSRAEPGPT